MHSCELFPPLPSSHISDWSTKGCSSCEVYIHVMWIIPSISLFPYFRLKHKRVQQYNSFGTSILIYIEHMHNTQVHLRFFYALTHFLHLLICWMFSGFPKHYKTNYFNIYLQLIINSLKFRQKRTWWSLPPSHQRKLPL